MLIAKGKSVTRITFTITVQSHHVRTHNMTTLLIIVLLLLLLGASRINSSLGRASRDVLAAVRGLVLGALSVPRSQVAPGSANRLEAGDVAGLPLRHCRLVIDVGGLVTEGAEAEDALE
jgi:hypothetical protein